MRSPLKKKDRAIVENFPTSSPRSRRVVFPGMEFHATTTTPAIAHNGCGPPYRGGSFPAGKKWIPMETDYTPASISNIPPASGIVLEILANPALHATKNVFFWPERYRTQHAMKSFGMIQLQVCCTPTGMLLSFQKWKNYAC